MKTPRRPVFLDLNVLESITPDEDIASWSIVANEVAEILIGKTSSDPVIFEGVVALIEKGDLEDIATLWSKSPNTCLAGLLWRSFLIYQWLKYDSDTLKTHFVNGLKAPLENTTKVNYDEVTSLLSLVMEGKFSSSGKSIYDFYADMAAFLRVLALGVSFANFKDTEVVFCKPSVVVPSQKVNTATGSSKENVDYSSVIGRLNKADTYTDSSSKNSNSVNNSIVEEEFFSEILVLKANSLLTLASDFENASSTINTLNISR